MAQDAFNSFINSVYGSGTAMSYFDHRGGMVVAGEAIDDISVEAIFGAAHEAADKHTHKDSDTDSSSDSDADSDADSDSDSEDSKNSKEVVANISICIHDSDSDSDSDSGSDAGDDSDGEDSIMEDISLDLSSLAKKEEKTGKGVSAHDVAMLIAPYK